MTSDLDAQNQNEGKGLRTTFVASARRSRFGQAILESEEQRRVIEEQAFVKQASVLWGAGSRRQSMAALRSALRVRGGTAALWEIYGQRLLETGRPEAALEAIESALEVDPSRFMALELYIELLYKQRGSYRGLQAKLRALAKQLRNKNQAHRESLDFFLPFSNVEGVELLLHSPDPIARAVAEINVLGGSPDLESANAVLAQLEDDEEREVNIRLALVRGRLVSSVKLLEKLPAADLPLDAIRRAIRRTMKKKDPSGAIHLIAQYRRWLPDDRWAASQKAQVQEFVASTYEHQEMVRLTSEGYPVDPVAPAAKYAPLAGSVFYLLHNSLPYNSAGYATRSHGLLRSLNRQGWEVSGITRPGFPFDLSNSIQIDPIASSDMIDGVVYERLSTVSENPKKRPLGPYVEEYAARLATLAEARRPSIIHAASNHWNGLAAVQAGNRLGIPTVYEVRGLWEVTRGSRDPEWMGSAQYRFMAQMEAEAARHATHVLCITAGLRDEMISRGIDAEKITLVPNGVDSERFVPRDRNAELVKSLRLFGKTVIGYVGSVLDYEGLNLLVEAGKVLSGRRRDFHIVIVGDGAGLGTLKELASELGVTDVVTFTGRVPHDDVEDYYSVIDIAPLPRLPLPVCEMVSPLKPFEAMATGKVVVASDVAALAEIVTPGINGLLHEKGSSISLAGQLERLLDDQDLLVRLGSQAREWVVNERDWKILGETVSSVYGSLLDRSVDGTRTK